MVVLIVIGVKSKCLVGCRAYLRFNGFRSTIFDQVKEIVMRPEKFTWNHTALKL